MTTRSSIPFNISILQMQDADVARFRKVTSLDIFEAATQNFNSEGLFSTEIFGIAGSEARSTRFAYIDLKIPIIHPTIFNAITQMKSLYKDIMASREFAVWDPNISDFVKSNIIEGRTGFQFFVEYMDKIQFEERDSVRREQAIRLIKKYQEKTMIDKILVLPAGLRDVEIDESGRTSSDEINDFYYKLLAISNTINPSTVKVSPEAYNSQRMSLQNTFNDIYTYLSKIIEGKKNLMMGKWASRKVFNGTRNVLTAMDTTVDELGSPANVHFNDTMVGIYQTAKAMLPVTIYQFKTGFLSKVFSVAGAPALLTNKKTLMSERVELKNELYDQWLSNEGLEKFLTYFQENSVRHDYIKVGNDHYLGLMYRGNDGTFKLISGIDELPDGRTAEECRPITIAEFIYTQIYHVANKYTAWVTRYPVTGVGSTYPSKVFLKSTIKKEVRRQLDDNWLPLDAPFIAYEFPVMGSDFFNSMSPHTSKLKGLGADHDGDTGSFTVVYSDEAVAETNEFLNSKKCYVGTNGRFVYDCNVDTIQYILHNLTGD